MAVGQIFNSDGQLMVDLQSSVGRFYTMGTVNTAGAISYSAQSSVRIDVPVGIIPLIALRCAAGIAPYYAQNNNNGTRTYWYNSSAPVGTMVVYYVFDLKEVSQAAVGATKGLRILRDDGNTIAYDSSLKPPVVSAYSTGGSITLPNGRLYAACVSSFSGYRRQTPQPPDQAVPSYYDQKAVQNGCSIYIGNGGVVAAVTQVDFLSGRANNAAPDFNIPFAGMLVLDVTTFGSVPGEKTYAVRMNPTGQAIAQVQNANATFGPFSIAVDGSGAINGYNWYIESSSGSSWSVSSGQGSATAYVTVSGVPEDSGPTAVLACNVTVNGESNVVRSNLTYYNKPNANAPSVTISQSISRQGTTANSNASFSITVNNGAASSYNWSLSNVSGSMTIVSGQGTGTVTVRANASPGNTSSAIVNCTVVVNGQTYTKSASYDYTNQDYQ